MQLGAFYAGVAIQQSMLGAAHASANPLTASYDMTHGVALAILLPHVVRWNAHAAHDLYREFVNGMPLAAASGEAGNRLAERLIEIGRSGGFPVDLRTDYGLTHSCYDPTPSRSPCRRCDSCHLCARGFAEAGLPDPLDVR